jgi:isoleucyl-tRNA synthetase
VRVTEELKLEGLARDLIRLLQEARKSMGLKVADRIRVRYQAEGAYLEALRRHGDRIAGEVLAVELAEGPLEGFGTGVEDEEGKARFALERVEWSHG